ncbi:hypothetical protein GCK72_025741 [Caenorhabditis remanei]|uniref:Uncharacterized protein n=1 Tax=Caenorhabditis remanei TaxID=31234 RepID=E3ME07_CAERE|nr:hypothetical protein GCK72_025741 [Caenorhabditis remanei]EFO99390.1 hypothetical protein CRE_22414 [Caenorhabditis remanei]KAF1749274.1 hypothetical protein GCK72_025741 [Caenorhabditis remanei]
MAAKAPPAKAETPPKDFAITSAPFYTDCLCCRKNFESLKMTLLTGAAKSRMKVQDAMQDPIVVFSRPEKLDCEDCEGLKVRFNELLASMYLIEKDQEGFINLTCIVPAALYLMKGTAPMNHLIPAQYQTNFRLII